MPAMNNNFQRLEAQLEGWFESAFTGLFGRTVRAHDLAVHLARAIETNAEPPASDDTRPLAPDQFTIQMNPDALLALQRRHEGLENTLGIFIQEMVQGSGYRLANAPSVYFAADPDLHLSEVRVDAEHARRVRSATAVLKRVENPHVAPATNASLLIDGEYALPLRAPIITIGRSHENDIVLDDVHVSRHHAQLRLRFGSYTLFDSNSQSGTYINDVPVREYVLQAGDVIRLGKTRLVYLEDERSGDSVTQAQRPFD